jgi:hypothetical protein
MRTRSAAVLQELDAALAESPRTQALPANNWTSPLLHRHPEQKYEIRPSAD